jgi:hypothetical protein
MNTLLGWTARAVAAGAAMMAMTQAVCAKDAFDAVKCDGDIAKALVGGKIGNEPVATIEKRHAAIGLEDEGGDEISDAVSYQSWTLCGGSYHMLERGGVIRDVVRADHSRETPSFLGACKVEGVEENDQTLAVLEMGTGNFLRAKSAWRIDEPAAKFVPMDVKGLMCPAAGIATADGGH